jgi:hypothetical protein
MNTTSNTRLRLNYPSWLRPHSHWSSTDPRNQQTTTQTRTAETCTACCLFYTGQTDGLRRSDRWPAPVRPVTPVRPVDRASYAGGCSNRTTNVPESLSDFSRPWNHNTSNATYKEEEPFTNPSKTPPKQPRTDQQQHDPKTHESRNSPEANPTQGTHRQTGH